MKFVGFVLAESGDLQCCLGKMPIENGVEFYRRMMLTMQMQVAIYIFVFVHVHVHDTIPAIQLISVETLQQSEAVD